MGLGSTATASSRTSAKTTDQRRAFLPKTSSRRPSTRSSRSRYRASGAGSLPQMPRHGWSAPSSWPCCKPLSVRTSPLSGMAAREPCSIATSRGWRSIAATISPRQMAETGSPSTGRAENFYVTAAVDRRSGGGNRVNQLTSSICHDTWRSSPRLASAGIVGKLTTSTGSGGFPCHCVDRLPPVT